jgi:formylglycine-generating enzyme required for sulfatase activity
MIRLRYILFPTFLAAFAVSTICCAQDEAMVIENSIGMKLVRIPAGTFMMGSTRSEPERIPNEVLHEVTITRPYYMGVHEVTQAQYTAVMRNAEDFRNNSAFDGPQNPMENVEWQKATRFCEVLSALPAESDAGRRYRLPTEVEWEYACRAGTRTPFTTGDSLSSRQANFNGNYPYGEAEPGPYLRRTAPVGSYQPNAFGLYDMHGNVAEWCADFYDPEYYENSPPEDPRGPPLGVVESGFGGFHMVVRGGCWLDDARGCRSAYRFRAMPETQYRIIGFRVVCDIKGEQE